MAGLRFSAAIDAAGLARRAEAAASLAAASAAEDIRRRAVEQAPRRSGALAASAAVEASGPRARVTFGADYAAIQHERRGLRHPGGGQAGFLADAVAAPATLRAMAEGFEKGMMG